MEVLCNRYCGPQELATLSTAELLCILWSLARNHHDNKNIVNMVVDRMITGGALVDMTSDAMAMLLWSLMMLGYTNSTLVERCCRAIPKIVSETTDAMDIATIMCALANQRTDGDVACFEARFSSGGVECVINTFVVAFNVWKALHVPQTLKTVCGHWAPPGFMYRVSWRACHNGSCPQTPVFLHGFVFPEVASQLSDVGVCNAAWAFAAVGVVELKDVLDTITPILLNSNRLGLYPTQGLRNLLWVYSIGFFHRE